MNQDKTFLGTEPIGKLLRQLAIPTVIAQLVNMLYNIVDRIYIGHIPGDGDLALTGVGVCLPLILIISAFAALVASGGAPRASIYMGRQDHETAERILGGCFALQICISTVLTAVLLLWSRDLLLAFGASENTIGYAADYMRIYAVGTVFVQMTLGLNAFITAQGFAQIGMRTVLIGAVSTLCAAAQALGRTFARIRPLSLWLCALGALELLLAAAFFGMDVLLCASPLLLLPEGILLVWSFVRR